MGNYRFRLSDMMPNAWFYKLQEMTKSKNHHDYTAATAISHSAGQKQTVTARREASVTAVSAAAISQPSKTYHSSPFPRKSYHFTRELKLTYTHFPDPPRASYKRRQLKRRAAVCRSASNPATSSVSASCSSRASLFTKSSDSPPDYSASSSSDSSSDESSDRCEDESSFPPEFRSDRVLATESMTDWSCSCACELVSDSNDDDIIIDVDKKSMDTNKLDISDPPIIIKKKITKEKAKHRSNPSAKCQEKNSKKEHNSHGFTVTRTSSNSPGLKLGANSSRISGSRRIHGSRKCLSSNSSSSSRRSTLSNSVAIVKSSLDPQKDFKKSMVEMIVENKIWASKDLEELLACYLYLNSDECHDLIIKVFKQILFEFRGTISK